MKVAIVGSRTLTVPDLPPYLPPGTDEIVSGGAYTVYLNIKKRVQASASSATSQVQLSDKPATSQAQLRANEGEKENEKEIEIDIENEIEGEYDSSSLALVSVCVKNGHFVEKPRKMVKQKAGIFPAFQLSKKQLETIRKLCKKTIAFAIAL